MIVDGAFIENMAKFCIMIGKKHMENDDANRGLYIPLKRR